MSNGALSASLGPTHLFIMMMIIAIEICKFCENWDDDKQCDNMVKDNFLANHPPLFWQGCALQVVETSPVRRKAGLNSPEDWYSTCLNLFVSNFRLLQHIRVNFLIFVFDDQRHSLSLLQGWKLEKVLRYSAGWTVLKDPHQQLHINMVASEITEIMKDLMDSSISKETGCCRSGILGQGYSPNNWRNVRAALSGIDHGKS